ncbi:hypothetical protein D1BOALGB6SA_10141 [Olavius sp. associated proteobacterium Delta 1]|nr:hypothetical protein D1BOALGB6SA_10141 [Olavius sp. associated proteobacterium Delta 1]
MEFEICYLGFIVFNLRKNASSKILWLFRLVTFIIYPPPGIRLLAMPANRLSGSTHFRIHIA